MLKVGVQCKDQQTKKFITAVCKLNPQSVYLNKEFSRPFTINQNDLLIIQELSSLEDEKNVLKFVKEGGRIVLFQISKTITNLILLQKWRATETVSDNNFLKSVVES